MVQQVPKSSPIFKNCPISTKIKKLNLKIFKIALKWSNMVQISPEWSQMAQHGPKCCKMFKNSQKKSNMVQNVENMIKNCTKWIYSIVFLMGPAQPGPLV